MQAPAGLATRPEPGPARACRVARAGGWPPAPVPASRARERRCATAPTSASSRTLRLSNLRLSRRAPSPAARRRRGRLHFHCRSDRAAMGSCAADRHPGWQSCTRQPGMSAQQRPLFFSEHHRLVRALQRLEPAFLVVGRERLPCYDAWSRKLISSSGDSHTLPTPGSSISWTYSSSASFTAPEREAFWSAGRSAAVRRLVGISPPVEMAAPAAPTRTWVQVPDGGHRSALLPPGPYGSRNARMS